MEGLEWGSGIYILTGSWVILLQLFYGTHFEKHRARATRKLPCSGVCTIMKAALEVEGELNLDLAFRESFLEEVTSELVKLK